MAETQLLRPHDHLRRLSPESYRCLAYVHWTMAVTGRRIGWLDERAHALWREVLLHTAHHYGLAAPVYCLMPDHAHVLLKGLSATSDQKHAVALLCRYAAPLFAAVGGEWQKQAYDHVLREPERERGAFAAVAAYLLANPVRAGLCANAGDWRYSGSVVAGSPALDWRRSDFWERFWTVCHAEIEPDSPRTGGTETVPLRPSA